LHDRARIGKAGGRDHEVVEPIAALQKLAQYANRIAAHRAADSALGGLEGLVLAADDEFLIDADFAKFIPDHCDAFATFVSKNAL